MNASPFAFLPGELRNEIWRFALIELSTPILVEDATSTPALLATCRQIRQECYKIYFGENTFLMWVGVFPLEYHCLPETWFHRIGPQATGLIRRLEIAHIWDSTSSKPDDHDGTLIWLRRSSAGVPMNQKRAEAILHFLLGVGVHLEVVRTLESAKQCHEHAFWTLLKELLDSKMAELMGSFENANGTVAV